MSQLPVFRRMIKAIGDHVNPKDTAFRYEIVEFRPNGTFQRLPAVLIDNTAMRADDVKVYEVSLGWEWRLIPAADFHEFKLIWDEFRRGLGYCPVDEMGNAAN